MASSSSSGGSLVASLGRLAANNARPSDSSESLVSMDGADRDNYEDCRIELRSHNLVSIL